MKRLSLAVMLAVITAGMKLKYKMAGEVAVILFDEAYFSPEDEQQ